MTNKYNWKPVTDENTLREMYKYGMTQTEIAEKFNVSQKVIWLLMKKYNIKTRIPKNLKQSGNYNSNWKGKSAGYKAKHYRIYKKLGCPRKCEKCGEDNPEKRYEWANLTGDYDNPNDYKRMCKKCHHKYDKNSHIKGKDGKFIPFVGGGAKCVKTN